MKARFSVLFILLAMPIILLQAGASNPKLNFEKALLLFLAFFGSKIQQAFHCAAGDHTGSPLHHSGLQA